MKSLQHTIKAVIRRGEESGYVAECLEITAVTQGETLDEVTRNLREAAALERTWHRWDWRRIRRLS